MGPDNIRELVRQMVSDKVRVGCLVRDYVMW